MQKIEPVVPDPLTFAELRKVNVARCEEVFHLLKDWSGSDWTVATIGEVGEGLEALGRVLKLADTIKKLQRWDDDRARRHQTKTKDELITELAKELADIVTYADLLAASFDIDLGLAVRTKFNEVSAKRGAEHVL